MNKVIRLSKEMENLIEEMKKEYIFFYQNVAKTKNRTLKSMAETEIKKVENYDEKNWIQYALNREKEKLKETNELYIKLEKRKESNDK